MTKNIQRIYLIWDNDREEYVKELPSKVDDGDIALLCFTSMKEAKDRAAKHWGYDGYYSQMKADGWGEVRGFTLQKLYRYIKGIEYDSI